MENLTGTVERIVYQNDENHWTVARLKLAETSTRYRAAQDLTTIVGPMPGTGTTLTLVAVALKSAVSNVSIR